MNGFRIYNGLEGVTYMGTVPFTDTSSDVRPAEQDILDLIFQVDPVSGFPTGSFEQFLSEKTSAEVRQFISDYLMGVNPETGLDVPSDVLAQYRQLPSDFIAECSRNRYESMEQFETRISEKVRQMREEEEFKKRFESLRKEREKNDN